MRATAIAARPYIGLRYFEERDAHLFYGRDGHVADLLAKVAENRFVAVMGSSGCGKSSLVRAGLLPELRSGMIPKAGPRWKVVEFRPGNVPLQELGVAIRNELKVERAQELVDEGPLGIARSVAEANLPERTNVLVIADQFEEVFRFQREEAAHGRGMEAAEQCQALTRRLLDAAAQPELAIYVLLVMRSDYLGECAQFPDLPERMSESLYLVPRLRRDELQEAITAPVRAEIEPAVVQRLLSEVGSDPDQLPRLQHLLGRMWDRANGSRLTMQHYTDAGGWDKGLEQHLEEVYGSLTSSQQTACARMFQQLSELDKGRAVRRRAEVAELLDVCGPGVSEVVLRFRAEGFLTPKENPVDITHECILREWPRLKEWLEKENRNARRLRELAEAANDAGWRPGLTAKDEKLIRPLAGLTLQNLTEWRDHAQPRAAWARRYLTAVDFDTAYGYLTWSEARDRERRMRERRQKRNLRIVFGVLFLGLAVASMVFYQLRREAEHQKRIAIRAQVQAETSAIEAKASQKDAEDQRHNVELEQQKTQLALDNSQRQEGIARAETDKANLQTRVTNANRLATESLYHFGARADFLALSGALALESLEAYPTTEGMKALSQVLRLLPAQPKIISDAHHGTVGALAFSRNGHWMASAGQGDGKVILWDLSNEMKHRVMETQFPFYSPAGAMTLNADGRWLAAACHGGFYAVCIWDTATGKPLGDPIRHDYAVRSIAFSPNGQYLATSTYGEGKGRGKRLFRTGSGQWKEVKTLPSDDGAGTSVLFDHPSDDAADTSVLFGSDKALAFADRSGIWISTGPSSLPGIDMFGWADSGSCYALDLIIDLPAVAALCEKGIVIAASSRDGKYEHKDVDMTFNSVRAVSGLRMAASPDGRFVAVGDIIYSLGDRSPSLVLSARGLSPEAVAYHPDGKILAGGLTDGTIAVWPTNHGNTSFRLPTTTQPARDVAISPDEGSLATVSDDGQLRLYDISDYHRTRQVSEKMIGPDLQRVFFSPDGRVLFVMATNRIVLFRVDTLAQINKFAVSGDLLTAFTRDGHTLILFDSSGIHRIDSATGLEKPPVFSGKFRDFNLSPDGAHLSTWSQYNIGGQHHYIEARRVWNLATGAEVAWEETGREQSDGPATRPAQGGSQRLVQEAAQWPSAEKNRFSSADRRWSFDLAGSSPTLVLKDAVTNREIAYFDHDDEVVAAAFSPGGRWLVTASKDDSVHLWPLQVKDLAMQACKLLPRNLTPEEWKEFQIDGTYRKICPELP